MCCVICINACVINLQTSLTRSNQSLFLNILGVTRVSQFLILLAIHRK